MSHCNRTQSDASALQHRSPSRPSRVRAAGRLVATLALLGLSPLVLINSASATTHPQVDGCASRDAASSEPSSQAPPAANWIPATCGATAPTSSGRTSRADGDGSTACPMGDPASMFDPTHVVVGDGYLSLLTERSAEQRRRLGDGRRLPVRARPDLRHVLRPVADHGCRATTRTRCSGRSPTCGPPRSTSTRPGST